MTIVICLGNNIHGYNFTRHNIGRDFLEWFISPSLYKENKSFYFYNDEDKKRQYIIPKTTMNISGTIFTEKELKQKYIAREIEKIIVIHDDLEVPFGNVKIRTNKERGHRGHNGNRSLIESLKSINKEAFILPYFISIGIDRSPEGITVSEWVLKKYTPEERDYIKETIFPKVEKELQDLYLHLKN